MDDLHSLEAERYVVACGLNDPDVFLLDLAPADFYFEEPARIWGAGQECIARGIYAGSEEIQDTLRDQGFDVPLTLLFELTAIDVFAPNAPAWADKVRDLAKRRAKLKQLEKSYGEAAYALHNSNGTWQVDVADSISALHAAVRRETVPATPKADLSECPRLPPAAQLDAGLAAGASPWLDAFIAYSSEWASRAHPHFHESVGLAVLSSVALRRVMVPLGGERYTNLYIVNVARSSVWTKSTAHKLGFEVIEAAGLGFLRAPDDATPQALLRRMGRQSVYEWDALAAEDQAKAKNRIAFAGQRGWDFDELGAKVSAMMRDSGPMADFHGMLRKFDDCPKSYEYETIARGSTMIDRPYLTILGSMTPADMAPFAKRGGPLWGDGFWARFAFVAPHPDEAPSMGRFPGGPRTIPPTLIGPLRNWHNLLGMPSVEVVERVEPDAGGDKAKQRKWDVFVGPTPVQCCTLGAGVFEAFYRYHDALVTIAAGTDNTDLDGNYSRFAEKALRVAALLGSFENGGLIELRHWARAQGIAERWRQSLHNLYLTLNSAQDDEAKNEDRVVSIVHRLGTATPVEVRRYLPDLGTSNVATIMERLSKAGALQVLEKTRKGTPRYAE